MKYKFNFNLKELKINWILSVLYKAHFSFFI